MTPTLKAPGADTLKLKYDEPLSKFAFNFNLRRYTPPEMLTAPLEGIVLKSKVGTSTRPLHSSP